MGLFDYLFGKRPKTPKEEPGKFTMLNGHKAVFHRHRGGLYQNELIRAAINARATHVSKLNVEIHGAARPKLQTKLSHGPNAFQTWSQFLYRLSVNLDVSNTAFICPVYDEYGEVSGIYAPVPERCEVVQYDGTPYLRYEFTWGDKAAIELSLCGIMTKHQYRHDFFGESNDALKETMDLITIQNQGIEEGVKSAANYRFMAELSNFALPEDVVKERKRFTELNLSKDADGGGIILFPNTYKNIKQVDVKPWVLDRDQQQLIKDNVFEYFGVNEDVLMNKAYGDAWNAFYEGAIEPFAIQFSEVLTKMLFTLREQSQGNYCMATSNRLQYMSNTDKLNVSRDLLDRGVMTLNQVLEIWQLPPVEGGDVRIIRGEYYKADDKLNEGINDDKRDQEL